MIIVAAIVITASLLAPPALSQSPSLCISCHGSKGYTQYLDILEGNTGNQLPTSLTIGQTATVKVIIENKVTATRYTDMTSVSATLSSQSGHFTVSSPTYNIGTLPKGTTTATWQITAVSAGSDNLIITAKAKNSHQAILGFSDSYSPTPSITILNNAATTTPTPTPMPTNSQTSTPAPTPTTTTTTTPTTTTKPASTQTPNPTTTPSTTPNTTSPTTPTPTQNIENQTPIPQENTNQPSLIVWLRNPKEGETLTPETTKTIDWGTNYGSASLYTTLELSSSGPTGPWTPIAENLQNTNNFNWQTPPPEQTSNEYYLLLTVIDTSSSQTASTTVLVKTQATSNAGPIGTHTIFGLPPPILSMAINLPLVAIGLFVLKTRKKTN